MACHHRLVQAVFGFLVLAVPFLLVFIGGLVIGVYTMLQGVTPAAAVRGTARIGAISAPSVAAFAIAFGALGYLLTAHSSLSYWLILLVAGISGSATGVASAPLIVKLKRATVDVVSESADVEGQVARVVRPVSESAVGEVAYERDGREFRHPALNSLAGVLRAGKEVVIDRIDGGVAYVEDWESVERRL